jgi:2-polyprenyl-3-methyl-5-hydroxy-6-metoxy-1,4-benzoquinol methylase
MSYAELTYRSHNPLKRLIQGNRYLAMLRMVDPDSSVSVLDYGCGDGFFLRLLRDRGVPSDRLIGFEPFGSMAAQFHTGPGYPELIDNADGLETLAGRRFSHIFCMEVLEHLDDAAIGVALDRIAALASPDTRIIVTVPSELGIAGALKCLFRKAQGTEVVPWPTIGSVLFSHPPARLVSDTPEGPYIYSHIGFDQKRLENQLAGRFQIVRRIGVPFRHLPVAVNNEVAFLCRLFPGIGA